MIRQRLSTSLILLTLIAGCGESASQGPGPGGKGDSTFDGGLDMQLIDGPSGDVDALPSDAALTDADLSGTDGFPADAQSDAASVSIHAPFAQLLQTYVSVAGEFALVDYDAWNANSGATTALDQYIATLAAIDPQTLTTPSDRFAYWINAYNATVIQMIMQQYAGNASWTVLDSGTFFDTPRPFAGSTLSLNQLENGVLRYDTSHASMSGLSGAKLAQIATWHGQVFTGTPDARLHAALNCGARGCPNLLASQPFVYEGAGLDAQLTAVTQAWLDSAKGAGSQGISKLFEWYGADFVAHSGSIGAFVQQYRTNGTTGVNLNAFIGYDWTLNITP